MNNFHVFYSVPAGVTETYIPGTPVHESKFNTNKCIRKEKSFESLLSDCYEDRKEKEKDVVVLGKPSLKKRILLS